MQTTTTKTKTPRTRKPRTTFRMRAYDGDFRLRDRLPNYSSGKVYSEHATKEAAEAEAAKWMAAHLPVGRDAKVSIEEHDNRRGYTYTVRAWSEKSGQWV